MPFIGRDLQKSLKMAGLSQAEFARRLGVSQGYINQLCNDKTSMNSTARGRTMVDILRAESREAAVFFTKQVLRIVRNDLGFDTVDLSINKPLHCNDECPRFKPSDLNDTDGYCRQLQIPTTRGDDCHCPRALPKDEL